MADATRTCAVCRRQLDRDDALRIVLGPAGEPVIDFGRRLPGRGANVCWTRDCLSGVRERGALPRAMKGAVELPSGDWPLGDARRWCVRRQVELAGLAFRAGELKAGGNVVDRLVKRGWPTALVLSGDAGETVSADWERRTRGRELELLRSSLSSEELGAALGRKGPRSVLAMGRGPLVRGLTCELKRGTALL